MVGNLTSTANTPGAPAIPAPIGPLSWIQRNVIAPVAQNLLASLVIAAVVAGIAVAVLTFGMCSGAVKQDVAGGEVALAHGDAVLAARIAADASAVADNCACTHALMAAAQSALAEKARTIANPVAQEGARAECYREAAKAKRQGDRTARTEALLKVCKLSSPP